MTQTMVNVDGARTRMPLVCTVISAFVWAVVIAICFTAWLLATNDSGSDSQGPNIQAGPQSNTSAKSRDSQGSESLGRPGRRF